MLTWRHVDLDHYDCNKVQFSWPKDKKTGSTSSFRSNSILGTNSQSRANSFEHSTEGPAPSSSSYTGQEPNFGSLSSSRRGSQNHSPLHPSRDRSATPPAANRPYPSRPPLRGRRMTPLMPTWSPSDQRFSSERGIYESPERSKCQKCARHQKPQDRKHTSVQYQGGQVACLSSGLDNQYSWIIPRGATTTSVVCKILRDCSGRISYRDLVTRTGNEIHGLMTDLRKSLKRHGNPTCPDQTPQWGSMYPLELDELISL